MRLLEVSRRDAVVAAVVFGTLGVFFGYSRWDVWVKRAELISKADMHAAEYAPEDGGPAYEKLVETDSDKSFMLFGKDWGVVRVYVRREGDTAMESFLGVEHFYEYQDGGWRLADKARIVVPEHVYEGYTKFEAAGFAVDGAAYERFNR